jgi:hypothetical protein
VVIAVVTATVRARGVRRERGERRAADDRSACGKTGALQKCTTRRLRGCVPFFDWSWCFHL